MSDALLSWLRQTLPKEIADLTEPYITKLERAEYHALLESDEAKSLFGHRPNNSPASASVASADASPVLSRTGDHVHNEAGQTSSTWSDDLFHRLGTLLSDRSESAAKQVIFFCIGYAALLSFLQASVTGPPLLFSSARLLLPLDVAESKQRTQEVRGELLKGLGVDGVAAYKLTPNVELLCMAEAVMTCPAILKGVKVARWAKMRVAFIQQRLLSEVTGTLQDLIYDDLDMLDSEILGENMTGVPEQAATEFLLERATVHIHHGLDKLARNDLESAKRQRRFEFALTGLLGKRTKYQENNISQLVVLARSQEDRVQGAGLPTESTIGEVARVRDDVRAHPALTGPTNLDLNDDTLLEAIEYSEKPADSTTPAGEAPLPESLKVLDPANQPQLNPLDSTILLSYASSITNTSPQHGLTREETLPYATRVLDGGSSNWQVYTQALLVRSRIEGHKSRTIERGLLQLQALVDQVIADTASVEPGTAGSNADGAASTSFLPRPKESENAPVTERLRYIFQLASPTRWDLEAELASRWVQMGGLRSALEIYERLEMWAEAALCWAATEREDKAKKIVRRQLFHPTNGVPNVSNGDEDDDETWEGPERIPPPLDAPRLYSILGDIDQSIAMYEKAWSVSNQRYARAQRSLGRLYFSAKDYVKAAEAYSKSLKVNQLNHGSWFALGCALLELEEFGRAVEAFSRCVQLDGEDAESWSNLAAALLRIDPKQSEAADNAAVEDGEKGVESANETELDPQRNRQDALAALKRAAKLKHESYRIWENLLVVAASLSPPDYTAILAAQKSIISLRGSKDGEKCIDKQILALLAGHVMSTSDHYDPSVPGLPRMFVNFIDTAVIPLITSSAELWQLVAKLALWRNKPSSALEAEEKAWRAVTTQPGWETEDEGKWGAVVEATVRLCDAYESLGPRERTEGLGGGEGVVEKGWKFKAKSAVRGAMGKGKEAWEGTDGWERLVECMEGLKA